LKLLLLAKVDGANAAIQHYDALKKSGQEKEEINEGTLNGLGYTLLQGRDTQGAILVFQRNVQEYPESWNVYDSLGEAYMDAGQKDLAISNYEKSVQLNPKNQNGIDMLKKLKETN
jgi:Flp pilus assembly protein TadD